jgi:hypothetical protein
VTSRLFDREWRKPIARMVEQATLGRPEEVVLLIGFSPVPGWNPPSLQQEQDYAAQLMLSIGYELMVSEPFLPGARRLVFRLTWEEVVP